MTFSPEWETRYVDNKVDPNGVGQLFHTLDVFTHGHQARVLEIGCGLGANVQYWLNRQASYHGIEGSQTAVQKVKERYPYIADRLVQGDFTQGWPFEDGFDVIFDRASISHNDGAAIARCLGHVWDALKPGGIFVGVDWFSINHSEYNRGDPAGDDLTRTGFPDGQFTGVGKVHFATHDEIDELFSRFEGVFLQERLIRRPGPNGRFVRAVNSFRWVSPAFNQSDYTSALWDIVARKPK